MAKRMVQVDLRDIDNVDIIDEIDVRDLYADVYERNNGSFNAKALDDAVWAFQRKRYEDMFHYLENLHPGFTGLASKLRVKK